MFLIVRLLVTALVAYFLTYFMPGVKFDGFASAVVFAIVLGLFNMVITPILKFLGLPLTILTLGFFSLVINAIVILMIQNLITGMTVDGFWWAFFFSIVLSIVTSFVNSLFGQ